MFLRLCLLVVVLFSAADRAHAVAFVRVPSQATLQQAIDTVDDGGVIEIAAGSYNAPAGGFTILNANRRFTVRAANAASVTLNGAGTNILRFSNISRASGRPVVFERLIFSAGVSNAANVGGAVTLVEADATFVGCTFQNNSAPVANAGGGGVLAQASQILIVDSLFTGNNAQRYGGAMGFAGGSRVAIHNSQFINNRVNLPNHFPDSLGGALFVLDSELRFTNTRFENNQAGFSGGAIYSFGTWSTPLSTPKTDIIGSNSTFVGNRLQRDPTSPAPGALTGGAIQTEDHVTLRLFHTRFSGNLATQGGAVANYRSIVEVHNGEFLVNRSTGTAGGDGYGGSLLVVSDDQNLTDSQNRRTGSLLVRDSLFRGDSATLGRYGGCIVAIGDTNRAYGLAGGIPQMGTIAENRAVLDIDGSAFRDCLIAENAGGGFGGAIMTQLADVRITNSIFLNSQAQRGAANTGSGGALAMFDNSTANVQNTTFARSAAGFNGGAIWLQGSHLDMSGSRLFDNQTLSGGWGGSVLFAAPENLGAPRTPANVTGLLQNNVLSNNTGGAVILDYDNPSNPVNLVRYSSNSVYPNDTTFFANPLAPSVQTVAQLNGLSLHGSPKASVANTGLANAPIVGGIVAAPTAILATKAAGEPATPTISYLTYAWSGGTATLNGTQVVGGAGFAFPAGPGTHVLSVAGTPYTDTIVNGPIPATVLSALPADAATGASSTLSWSTVGGTFLAQVIDQGIALSPPLPASGSLVQASLSGSRVYRGLLVTREGGALDTARLDVDDSLIFKDDFQ